MSRATATDGQVFAFLDIEVVVTATVVQAHDRRWAMDPNSERCLPSHFFGEEGRATRTIVDALPPAQAELVRAAIRAHLGVAPDPTPPPPLPPSPSPSPSSAAPSRHSREAEEAFAVFTGSEALAVALAALVALPPPASLVGIAADTTTRLIDDGGFVETWQQIFRRDGHELGAGLDLVWWNASALARATVKVWATGPAGAISVWLTPPSEAEARVTGAGVKPNDVRRVCRRALPGWKVTVRG